MVVCEGAIVRLAPKNEGVVISVNNLLHTAIVQKFKGGISIYPIKTLEVISYKEVK